MPVEGEVGRAGAIGLTVGLSLLHAALPNHWLPFVLVGRSLKWTRRRTLGIVALAGGGHVLVTSILGLAVWAAGDAFLKRLDPEHVEVVGARIGGGLLIALGLVYIVRQALGGHAHTHAHAGAIYADDHDHHPDDGHHDHKIHERGAVLTLFAALTLSPCGAVVAAFLSGARYGPGHVLALALGASLTTVLAMFVLTWLTLAGVEKLRFPWLDRNEMMLTGAILVGIGVLVLLVPG